jgi:hypothetical protein
MIFYFTGTGNSLYVAKQLEEEPISIPQVIHKEELSFRASSIGVVCPVYGHEMPGMVKEFIKRQILIQILLCNIDYGRIHGGAARACRAF